MTNNPFSETILVTGAGRGIGKALALSLAKPANHIICLSKTNHCVNTADEIIANGGKASALQADLSNYELTHTQITDWIEDHQPINLSVIAAAAILGPTGPLKDSSLIEWENTFNINLLGNLAVIKAALPTMEKNNYGRILMFAGGGSAYAYPMFPAYSASKTSVVRAVENLALDLKDTEIVITCISPGAIETDMLATIKAAGAVVRTPGNIRNVIHFVNNFLNKDAKLLSGRFIHVLDDWQSIIEKKSVLTDENLWKLRRIEE